MANLHCSVAQLQSQNHDLVAERDDLLAINSFLKHQHEIDIAQPVSKREEQDATIAKLTSRLDETNKNNDQLAKLSDQQTASFADESRTFRNTISALYAKIEDRETEIMQLHNDLKTKLVMQSGNYFYI